MVILAEAEKELVIELGEDKQDVMAARHEGEGVGRKNKRGRLKVQET